MPFCPDCGTEVSEETQFCPECGRQLAIGQGAKGISKKKLAGIIIACTIAIIVIVVIATRPPTPLAQIYTLTTDISPSGAGSISPSGGEYESGVQVTLTASPASGYTFDHWSGGASDTTSTITISMNSDKSLTAHFETTPTVPEEPEPAIPAHFTTYTDELGLFSISYPSEWDLVLEYMEEIEQVAEDIISSITSDLPVEEASFLFAAGLPTMIGFDPSVNIVVEPLPGTMWIHDEVVTAEIEGLKTVVSDYQELSRVKTTIDNRTATIIEWQGNIPGYGKFHDLQMMLIVSKTVWVVTCAALPDEYSEWEDDFDDIVRSLRILK